MFLLAMVPHPYGLHESSLTFSFLFVALVFGIVGSDFSSLLCRSIDFDL